MKKNQWSLKDVSQNPAMLIIYIAIAIIMVANIFISGIYLDELIRRLTISVQSSHHRLIYANFHWKNIIEYLRTIQLGSNLLFQSHVECFFSFLNLLSQVDSRLLSKLE